LDFHPSPAAPCLYIKKTKGNEPSAYIILYVDDGVIVGTPKIIEQVMKSISSVLKVKNLDDVKNFVGCRLVHSTDGKTIHIFQPKLIKNREDSFSQYIINTNRKFQTPGSPKTVVMRPEKGDTVLSPKDQTKYCSGVGMLLYLVKHSRPDISNAVRELTKVLDGDTNAPWKSLIRTIKFLGTRLYALGLSPFTRNGSLFLHMVILIVNLLVIEKPARVLLVLLHSCVVLLYLGNQNHVTVLPYHPQKLNTMLVLKQPKKGCSSKVF
jgi:hypothetical protein